MKIENLQDDSPQAIDYYSKLFDGVRSFKTNEFIPRQQFFEELGKSQKHISRLCLLR